MKRARVVDQSDGILIVGDWVIDEYWVLSHHHSEASAHEGFKHYPVSSNADPVISDLCGAGQVARVFYQIRQCKELTCRFFGLGIWHESDQEIITHLMHDKDERNRLSCLCASSAMRLKRVLCTFPPDINLRTLDKNGPTNRVIREFHQENGGFQQLSRVDWTQEACPNSSVDKDISRW